MDQILRGYHVDDPTWLYLSFLLILAVYFKFNRLWSVRNLDLGLLLSISPGLLLVRLAPPIAAFGYVWLFVVSALLLGRVLYDGLIVRRPRLEQNMNAAGMTFLCAATFLFLTGKLLTQDPPASTVESVRRANELIDGEGAASPARPVADTDDASRESPDAAPAGPGASLVAVPVAHLSKVVAQRRQDQDPSPMDLDVLTARLIAIFAHLAVIFGLTLVGRHIFGDPDLGFAMATLYMLLPCTAFDAGKINHVLPAALIVWAIWAYRRPFVSGTLLALACAMMFFPVCLLPVWAAFYGRRGGVRFGAAILGTTAAVLATFALLSHDAQSVARPLLAFVESNLPLRSEGDHGGFWGGTEAAYRIPVFVAYIVMLVALTLWPRRKSLAQVITHSAALVIGMQFWYPQEGGVYVLWYLPLLLLVMFRPQMTNHVAPEYGPLNLLAMIGVRERKPKQLVGSLPAGENHSSSHSP